MRSGLTVPEVVAEDGILVDTFVVDGMPQALQPWMSAVQGILELAGSLVEASCQGFDKLDSWEACDTLDSWAAADTS